MEAARLCQLADCTIQQLECETPWSNRTEGHVGLVKSEILLDLKESNCPMVLWCYAVERRGKILASTSRNIYSLGGQVPATVLTGQQPDISTLAETGWYEWVYYRDSVSRFPYPVECLGRCLGPCEHKGTVISQHVLNYRGNVLPYQTFPRLTKDEHRSAAESLKRDNFYLIIKSKLGDSMTPPPKPIALDEPEVRTPESIPDADSFSDFDEYINA